MQKKLTKPCIYCSNEISIHAILCPVCKTYQSRLRNSVVFLGSLAGIIAIVSSAMIFVSTALFDLIRTLRTPDFNLVSFTSWNYNNYDLKLINPKKSRQYITKMNLEFYAVEPYLTEVVRIEKTVDANQFYQLEHVSNNVRYQGFSDFIANQTGEVSQIVLSNLNSRDSSKIPDSCFHQIFTSLESQLYMDISDRAKHFGKKLAQLPARIELSHYDEGSGIFSIYETDIAVLFLVKEYPVEAKCRIENNVRLSHSDIGPL